MIDDKNMARAAIALLRLCEEKGWVRITPKLEMDLPKERGKGQDDSSRLENTAEDDCQR
jgi:hypothetical protein